MVLAVNGERNPVLAVSLGTNGRKSARPSLYAAANSLSTSMAAYTGDMNVPEVDHRQGAGLVDEHVDEPHIAFARTSEAEFPLMDRDYRCRHVRLVHKSPGAQRTLRA
jgi:hypothetical protein